MKRFLAIFLILFLICIIPQANGAPTKRADSAEVEVETKDGFVLEGTLYFAKEPNRPLVIMLHSFGMKSSNWGELPKSLRDVGYNVFTLDLRGHGKSVYDTNMKYHSRNYFSTADWKKFPVDVLESIDYIQNNYPKVNCNETVFIGADLGANTAVLAGARLKIKPKCFVLISPLVNFKGLYIPIVISNFSNSPMLIMASEQDKSPMAQADMLSRFVQSPVLRKNYPAGGTGMLLLKRNKGAQEDILDFLKPVK